MTHLLQAAAGGGGAEGAPGREAAAERGDEVGVGEVPSWSEHPCHLCERLRPVADVVGGLARVDEVELAVCERADRSRRRPGSGRQISPQPPLLRLGSVRWSTSTPATSSPNVLARWIGRRRCRSRRRAAADPVEDRCSGRAARPARRRGRCGGRRSRTASRFVPSSSYRLRSIPLLSDATPGPQARVGQRGVHALQVSVEEGEDPSPCVLGGGLVIADPDDAHHPEQTVAVVIQERMPRL